MWTQVTGDNETNMIAIINTLLFIISIAWFIIIASAIFSWLYAFNVINTNNQVIASIGRALYNLVITLDLQRISLGGSVFWHNRDFLLPRLQAQVDGHLPPLTRGVLLVAAGLGDRVGDYAALALLD